MLLGLTHPLAAGMQFPLLLRFRDAGSLTVQVVVDVRQ
jgi:copper(I)-binding protein